MAREIHDELGQALTGIKMDVSALIHSAAPNRQARIKRYRAITNLIDEAIQSVRRIATDLRPGMLDDLGLVAAVEWAAEGFAARTSTKCKLMPGGRLRRPAGSRYGALSNIPGGPHGGSGR